MHVQPCRESDSHESFSFPCTVALASTSSPVQVDVDWARLPALAKLEFDGVELMNAIVVGFSSLQQLSSLQIQTLAVDEDFDGTQQSVIARLLRASPPALRRLALSMEEKLNVPLTQFRPDLADAVGGLTQLRHLTCGDLGAACRLGQLEALRVEEKSWPDLSGWEIAMLGALTCLTRLELDKAPAPDPQFADRKRGVEQVQWAWESARLG